MKFHHKNEERIPETHRRQEFIDKVERQWQQMSDNEKKKNILTNRNPAVVRKMSARPMLKPITYRESEFSMIEGMLVLYGLNENGGIKKICETELQMGRSF